MYPVSELAERFQSTIRGPIDIVVARAAEAKWWGAAIGQFFSCLAVLVVFAMVGIVLFTDGTFKSVFTSRWWFLVGSLLLVGWFLSLIHWVVTKRSRFRSKLRHEQALCTAVDQFTSIFEDRDSSIVRWLAYYEAITMFTPTEITGYTKESYIHIPTVLTHMHLKSPLREAGPQLLDTIEVPEPLLKTVEESHMQGIAFDNFLGKVEVSFPDVPLVCTCGDFIRVMGREGRYICTCGCDVAWFPALNVDVAGDLVDTLQRAPGALYERLSLTARTNRTNKALSIPKEMKGVLGKNEFIFQSARKFASAAGFAAYYSQEHVFGRYLDETCDKDCYLLPGVRVMVDRTASYATTRIHAYSSNRDQALLLRGPLAGVERNTLFTIVWQYDGDKWWMLDGRMHDVCVLDGYGGSRSLGFDLRPGQ